MTWNECLKPLRTAAFGLLISGLMVAGGAKAQTTATPTEPPPPAPPVVSAPAQAGSSTTAPAPSQDAKPGATDQQGASVGDTSISQALDVPARAAVVVSGSATWDSGFKTLTDAFSKLNAAIAANNLTSVGHPLAVFTATDDAGFKYSAMLPIGKAPEGKTDLTPDIKIGETPAGKAIRFQHRASYDDIDSTYEAITAYLDEKGLESKNIFAEEYLTMTKTSDDPSLEVDIYVFLK